MAFPNKLLSVDGEPRNLHISDPNALRVIAWALETAAEPLTISGKAMQRFDPQAARQMFEQAGNLTNLALDVERSAGLTIHRPGRLGE